MICRIPPDTPTQGRATLLVLPDPNGREVGGRRRERRTQKREQIAEKDKKSASPGPGAELERAGAAARVGVTAGLLSMSVPRPPKVARVLRSGFCRRPAGRTRVGLLPYPGLGIERLVGKRPAENCTRFA